MLENNDNYTQYVQIKMDELSDSIYEIEDQIRSMGESSGRIIAYLNDVRYTLSMGLALRRFLCRKYSNGYDIERNGYAFRLSSGDEVFVGNYIHDDYSIQSDDIKEYVMVMEDVLRRYNSNYMETALSVFKTPELRRLLRLETVCLRSKLFLLSFALRMDREDTHWFLTQVLAEQTYNFHQPEEIIAYFCQTNEEFNSYQMYRELLEAYQDGRMIQTKPSTVEGAYTEYVKSYLDSELSTPEDLLSFLYRLQNEFSGYSRTAFQEYTELYRKALNIADIYDIGEDDAKVVVHKAENAEQLAKEMLSCIPRTTVKKKIKGVMVKTGDFVPVGKAKTTSLPKSITQNLLMADRMRNLNDGKIPVLRKDLVYLKYWVYFRELQNENKTYSVKEYRRFVEECDAMLLRCGMTKLYPANRFENLILLSLLADNPYEVFEQIIDESFFDEPVFEDA